MCCLSLLKLDSGSEGVFLPQTPACLLQMSPKTPCPGRGWPLWVCNRDRREHSWCENTVFLGRYASVNKVTTVYCLMPMACSGRGGWEGGGTHGWREHSALPRTLSPPATPTMPFQGFLGHFCWTSISTCLAHVIFGHYLSAIICSFTWGP